MNDQIEVLLAELQRCVNCLTAASKDPALSDPTSRCLLAERAAGAREAIDAARSYLASPPAPAAQPAVPVLNEREAFWAWVEDRGCDTDGAWSAWQARAALSPLTAFCPACFAACDIKEMYAEAADAKRYRWLRANVMRMPDYAFSVDDEVEAAIESALSVRPSSDIADDIPGSTAAGGGNTTAALTDDALLRFAIERYRGEFNEAVMIDFMRELLRHVAGVKENGNG